MAYDLDKIIKASISHSNTSQETNISSIKQANGSDMTHYDLNQTLQGHKPYQPSAPSEKQLPPTSKSPNSIDPTLVRNNTPYQDQVRLAGLLERTGLPTIWERSLPCPCINPDSGQPKSNCPICQGKGIIFRDPHELMVAYQGSYRNPDNGKLGSFETGTTLGTPQLTETGIEEGITFRDRLTVPCMTLAQSFIFNLTDFRVTLGMFIPYKVQTINTVATFNDNDSLALITLVEGEDYTFDKAKNRLFVSEKYLGRNITLDLSASLRFYVSDIRHETRNYQAKKIDQKEVIEGNGNKELTNYTKLVHDEAYDTDILIYRAPKQLVLKRDDLFIQVQDFKNDNQEDKENEFIDPKTYDDSINSLMNEFD